jgi:hypothetical protein
MDADMLWRRLERVGFGAWFGAGLWFGGFGAQALFRRLGAGGAAAPLAALFPTFFAFGAASGLAALLGALARRGRGGRVGAAGLQTVTSLVNLLVVDPLVHAATPGSRAFAAGHLTSVLLALAGWLGAAWGLWGE